MMAMNHDQSAFGFWDGETCEYCGGAIIEKQVTLYRKIRGEYVLSEDVPAGVCMECGR